MTVKRMDNVGIVVEDIDAAKDVTAAGRWEFEGFVAADIRDEYVGNSVGMGGQNPSRYVNV